MQRSDVSLTALLLLLALVSVGCGGNARPAGGSKGPSPTTSVPTMEFATVSEALVALTSAYSENRKLEIRGIEEWLKTRSDSAVEELSRVALDDQAPLPQRLIACRAMARIGSSAVPSLVQLTQHSTEQLKYRAAESLSIVSPHDARSVEALRELLQRDDSRLKGYAIRGLGQAGSLAKDSVPDLVAILNDYAQPDSIRNDAKLALRRIDPRRDLTGIEKD
ncbi:MAG: HEAT repeat domain-containing protein [Planctomycetes bacterium]|nr:HEAT repeat domain-containing protein [Planctomycetota bacterium]